jgi:hypothetical protein
MINDLIKKILKNNEDKVGRLQAAITAYQNEATLSRKFSRQLKHCGSFLGRDYKCLLQVLPVALVRDFSNDPTYAMTTPLFVSLGRLCSLVFMRRIEDNFNVYTARVYWSVNDFISKLHNYDDNCSE